MAQIYFALDISESADAGCADDRRAEPVELVPRVGIEPIKSLGLARCFEKVRDVST